ncbi:hypothetical protein WS67_16760 [Burkholderia singularis]|uniref:Uncharacterized protein n=1 Tax=Burkholderia singularis TaxID=1503053 RepID=A0A103E0C6_9BURK|nr:hypothetical protein WS67_16760 [Burkholderia singularis]
MQSNFVGFDNSPLFAMSNVDAARAMLQLYWASDMGRLNMRRSERIFLDDRKVALYAPMN